MSRSWKRMMVVGPLAIVGLALFVALGGWIVMLLWNWLLPSLFGWPPISIWQALGLLLLCRILFGGHGSRGPVRSRIRQRVHERMDERCAERPSEERERWRQRVRERWGFGPADGETEER